MDNKHGGPGSVHVHSFSRQNGAATMPQIFQVGEVVVVSSSTELALSQGIEFDFVLMLYLISFTKLDF